MESAKYFILVGLLLFVMALSPGFLKRSPITSAIIYLLFGMMIGRHGFGLILIGEFEHLKLLETLTELTVIISLFTVGLKLRIPLKDSRWLVPLSLASASMICTVGLIALVAHFAIGLELGASILLGAILSPTDPVLASEVQMEDPNDHDHLKFSLSTEGGLNDGTAFPFVMLGLGLMGLKGKEWTMVEWVTNDVLWGILAAILIGVLTGFFVSKLAEAVERKQENFYLEDFLTISSIAISYGLTTQVHAYGFLAVFANALTIRQFELIKTTDPADHQKHELPDDVLSFNEQLERIFEVVSVVTVGILLNLNTFKFQYLIISFGLFFIIRPLSVYMGTIANKRIKFERLFLSWFGVRGIGSLYYLYYALGQGLKDPGNFIYHCTLWTIFFSIFVHGLTTKPMMRFWKKNSRKYSSISLAEPR